MKILVPTKRVPDTDQKIRVKEDGSGIDTDMLPFVLNPFDAIALEEALRIREAHGDDVEIVTAGIGDDEYEGELRTALAMGADRALLVECMHPLDPWNVARILHAIVRSEQPELVLMGKQAVDDDSNQAGQFLAAILDWPQATFASNVELTGEGLRVARETDLGIETISISLPAVVTADLRLNEPRYASLPSILKAKKKPVECIPIDSLDVAIEPRTTVVSMEAVSSQRSCEVVATVNDLISKCRDEAGVI